MSFIFIYQVFIIHHTIQRYDINVSFQGSTLDHEYTMIQIMVSLYFPYQQICVERNLFDPDQIHPPQRRPAQAWKKGHRTDFLGKRGCRCFFVRRTLVSLYISLLELNKMTCIQLRNANLLQIAPNLARIVLIGRTYDI